MLLFLLLFLVLSAALPLAFSGFDTGGGWSLCTGWSLRKVVYLSAALGRVALEAAMLCWSVMFLAFVEG